MIASNDISENTEMTEPSEPYATRDQLVELQSQLAFQEDTLQGLQDALADQQQMILAMGRQLKWLRERQDAQAAQQEEAGNPAQEKPPHY